MRIAICPKCGFAAQEKRFKLVEHRQILLGTGAIKVEDYWDGIYRCPYDGWEVFPFDQKPPKPKQKIEQQSLFD